MRAVIISVAPVAADPPAILPNPVDPQELARDIHLCAEQGASMVHLHVRDAQGQPTSDLRTFSETLDLVRQQDDIIIQASTGGLSTLSPKERCVALEDERVEVASLNMGSCNMGEEAYINTMPEIRYWAQRMIDCDVLPELEIFEVGMINNVHALHEQGLLPRPFFYNFSLGFPGSMPATPASIWTLRSWAQPYSAPWGVVHHHHTDLSLLTFAVSCGAACVRVGYEDGYSVVPGRPYMRNADMVAHAAKLIRAMGLEVATLAQAREILSVNPLVAQN